MTRSLTHSISESPDPPIVQSLNDSIPQSPRVSPSPRSACLAELAGLDDSKRLTRRQRENLCPRIKSHATWGIGIASAAEIDKLGIVPAVSLAARRAYRAMGTNVDLLLCDRGITMGETRRYGDTETLEHGNWDTETRRRGDAVIRLLPASPPLGVPLLSSSPRPRVPAFAFPPELSFTRGDSRSLHIAAASIIAKVARDRMMVDLARDFPGYDLAKHKGYGTAAHLAALRRLGPSAVHRRSFHVK